MGQERLKEVHVCIMVQGVGLRMELHAQGEVVSLVLQSLNHLVRSVSYHGQALPTRWGLATWWCQDATLAKLVPPTMEYSRESVSVTVMS